MSEQEATLDDFADSSGRDDQESIWEKQQLRDLVKQLQAGGTPDTNKGEYYNGDIPWVKTGELGQLKVDSTEQTITEQGLEESTARLFPSKTVLIAMYGATTGEVSILDTEATTNQACCGIIPDDDLNPYYLYYQLVQGKPQLKSLSAGSGQQNISKSILEKYRLPVAPLPEQRKIATVLSTVDRAIEKTEKVINQSQRVKSGVVQNLLTGGAYDHASYEDYRLGPIDLTKPKKWDLKPFDEFSYRIQDGPHITPDYVEEGIPFVSSQNVNPFGEEFDYSQYEKYISESTYEEINQNCRPEMGDLIISRRATIGPTQLIRQNERFGFFVGVAIIKTDDTVYNAFLEQLMNWSVMEKLWHLKSPGSTMKTLNLETIKNQKVPIPSIQEQKEISGILRSIDEGISNNQRYRESLQRFKRGLMQDLLSGTVRTTDTNIEVPDEIAQYG